MSICIPVHVCNAGHSRQVWRGGRHHGRLSRYCGLLHLLAPPGQSRKFYKRHPSTFGIEIHEDTGPTHAHISLYTYLMIFSLNADQIMEDLAQKNSLHVHETTLQHKNSTDPRATVDSVKRQVLSQTRTHTHMHHSENFMTYLYFTRLRQDTSETTWTPIQHTDETDGQNIHTHSDFLT